MNTKVLKKFAQEARRKLIEQVSAKPELVLNADSAELPDEARQGHIPEELPVKHQRIFDILDGRILSPCR